MKGSELVTVSGGALSTETAQQVSPAAVYLAGLQPTGRYTMMRTLDRIAAMMGSTWQDLAWHELRYEHVQALRAKLAETQAPATVNTALCAIRGVVRAAWRMGMVDSERYQRIADVQSVTGQTLPAGRAIGPGELNAVMRACAQDHTPAGARDAAIIAMGYAGGLRRAEIAGLDLGDLDDDGDVIALTVRGKRRKERLVYLNNGAAQALRDWLKVRGSEPGPLFMAGRKGGRINTGQRLTGQAVHDLLERRAQQAGVDAVSPHDLRRSFVSDLLEGGVDIATVAKMAGHSSVQTTARYDRRPEQAKRKAARTLHVPYYGRGVV